MDSGDFNGDGLSDLLVGGRYARNASGSRTGAVYLVEGSKTGLSSMGLASADAKLVGESNGDMAGFDVANAGDVDGDGNDDLLIGAYDESTGGSDAGAAYLVYGDTGLSDMSLSAADAKFTGEAAGDEAGRGVTGADLDDDGYADLLIGAPYHDMEHSSNDGMVYFVKGSAAPNGTTL